MSSEREERRKEISNFGVTPEEQQTIREIFLASHKSTRDLKEAIDY